MEKFCTNSVFDFTIWDNESNIIKLDTVKSNVFKANYEDGCNYLIVKDALIDIKVLDSILKGKYYNKYLRISADSTVRDLDSDDYDLNIYIYTAKLVDFKFEGYCDNIAVATFTFKIPFKDYYGFDTFHFTTTEK